MGEMSHTFFVSMGDMSQQILTIMVVHQTCPRLVYPWLSAPCPVVCRDFVISAKENLENCKFRLKVGQFLKLYDILPPIFEAQSLAGCQLMLSCV
jgi:hypothetical protein